MKFRLLVILIGLFSLAAYAGAPTLEAPTHPLKFKNWREQQILAAQNEVLRISARLHQVKSNAKADAGTDKGNDDFLNSSRFERAPDVTDKDLKSAQESLEAARELSLEDYADVYIANLKEQDPEQFSKLMDSLSREELSQLMKILVKNKTEEPVDATHGKALATPVVAISGAHS